MIKILFLEDKHDDAILIERELSRLSLKFTSKVVSNHVEFPSAIKQYNPDVIIAGYYFPQFSGLEVIDLVQKITPETPIIIVTRTEHEEIAVKCMQHGAWDFVVKNRLVRIHQAVKNVLIRKEERAQNLRSQESLEHLISNIPGFFFRCQSNNNWTMEFLSNGCKLITGYPKEDLLNDRIIAYNNLIYPEDQNYIRKQIFMKLNDQNQYRIEYRIIHKTGKILWVEENGHAIYQNEELVLLEGFITDISEKKHFEEQIVSTQKLSNAIIDNSPLGISVRDRNGTLFLHNNSWKNIWAFSDEEINSYYKQRSNLVLDKKDNYLGKHLSEVQKVYTEGGTYYVHAIKTNKPRLGKANWISQRFYAITDNKGDVDKVVILTEDISERKRSQTLHSVLTNLANIINLEQSQYDLINIIRNELSRLMDTTNFFIALLNKETGQIIFPYSKDEVDNDTRPIWLGKTLSSHIIRTGKPMLVTESMMNKMEASGEIERVGTKSKVWMGVPLYSNKEVIGAVALQSYDNLYVFSKEDLKNLILISPEIAAIIQKKKIDDEIAIQKIYFENLFEVSPDALVVLSNDDKVMRVNEKFTNLFGYTNEEARGKLINDLIVPEQNKDVALELTKRVSNGESIHIETVRKNKFGETIWVECIGKPIILKSNQIAVQGIYRDITERKASEDKIKKDLLEKKTLLQELYHRTKNNMQVISSLLYMSRLKTHDEDVKDIFRDIDNKIRSMSLVHQKLYQSKNLSQINLAEYLEDLLKLLIKSFGADHKNIELKYEMEDVQILMDSAIPLGLVINELITNIIKHAFPDTQKHNIISLKLRHLETGEIILDLKDNGRGIPAAYSFEKSSSLGLRTALNLIKIQLKGSIEYKNNDGLEWKIIIRDDQHKARV